MDTETAEIQQWIENVLNYTFELNFFDELKSGVLLCKLLNKITDSSCYKYEDKKYGYVQKRNINTYLWGCRVIGIKKHSCFTSNDLLNMKNLDKIIKNLFALKMLNETTKNKTKPFKEPIYDHESKNMKIMQNLKSVHDDEKHDLYMIELIIPNNFDPKDTKIFFAISKWMELIGLTNEHNFLFCVKLIGSYCGNWPLDPKLMESIFRMSYLTKYENNNKMLKGIKYNYCHEKNWNDSSSVNYEYVKWNIKIYLEQNECDYNYLSKCSSCNYGSMFEGGREMSGNGEWKSDIDHDLFIFTFKNDSDNRTVTDSLKMDLLKTAKFAQDVTYEDRRRIKRGDCLVWFKHIFE